MRDASRAPRACILFDPTRYNQGMQSSLPIFLSQLIGLAPHLIVYIGGIVLVAVWWRRAPSAAMLAVIGLGIMLLSSVVGAMATSYLINNRTGATGSFAQTMSLVSFAFSVLRAIGVGFLVAAVFAGRARIGEGRAFEVQPASGTPDRWSGA